MWRWIIIVGLILGPCWLTSCVMTVDGIWVSGRVHDLTTDDIRLAIAADLRELQTRARFRQMAPPASNSKPRQIDVVGKDEIHLYWRERKAVNGSHDIVKRLRGKWRFDAEILEIRDPIPYNPI
jgi:hypothetical protein